MSDFVQFAEKVVNFLRSILVNGEPKLSGKGHSLVGVVLCISI